MGSKKALSEAEDHLVVEIPLIVGIRPVVVQPQAIRIVFNLEDIEVAIGIRVYDAPSVPPSAGGGLYMLRDRESSSAPHQVLSFLDVMHLLRW